MFEYDDLGEFEKSVRPWMWALILFWWWFNVWVLFDLNDQEQELNARETYIEAKEDELNRRDIDCKQ